MVNLGMCQLRDLVKVDGLEDHELDPLRVDRQVVHLRTRAGSHII